jgi:enolase
MSELQIERVRALEVLDSRGNPTVRAWVQDTEGRVSSATAPSGASTGAYEAVELRDGGTRYSGRGVADAVGNVTGEIADLLASRPWSSLADADRALIGLDGTPAKRRLGGNATVAVSMALARAFAAHAGLPLHAWTAEALGRDERLPVPHFNVLNGGQHAPNALDFQEFMIAPLGAPTYPEAVRWGAEVYHAFGARLKRSGLASGLGDEGGYAPEIDHPEQALDLIMDAIADAGLAPAREGIAIALDPAANSFHRDGAYRVAGGTFTAGNLTGYYARLIDRYPIWSLEDPLAEDDDQGWVHLTEALGDRVRVVGDDVFVTDAERVREAIRTRSATAVLIKPNQAGTVTETLATLTAAARGGFGATVSHRSGETEDAFVADLAVGAGCGQLKSGAPARGERTAKYNRLLEIAAENPRMPYGLPPAPAGAQAPAGGSDA